MSPARRLLLLPLLCAIAAPAHAEPPADLERMVETLRQKIGAPGVSIAVVEKGRTTVARGWFCRLR